MNYLQIGLTAKDFEYPAGSLVITNEPILDRGAKYFDLGKHGSNTLPMPYREAGELAAALFPDKELMTCRNGRRALTRLVMKAEALSKLKYTRNDDDQEAKGVFDDALLSPLLRQLMSRPVPRWSLSGSTIIARLDRKEIGDDDAKIIANILISKFKGQIVIPDFGFYAREHHAALITNERLMAGVYTLSELPERLRARAMQMMKVGKGCTFEDAEVLAKDAGLRPDPAREDNPYNRFIKKAMSSS